MQPGDPGGHRPEPGAFPTTAADSAVIETVWGRGYMLRDDHALPMAARPARRQR